MKGNTRRHKKNKNREMASTACRFEFFFLFIAFLLKNQE